ncbi:MAG: polymer-forming cytoskeletal protein [Bacteriovoracaceae bacterium]|jgi:cytoskeletal protein CcmA (bactofilin family)|nr:polymer-forming cytoskeletal protein [Bacteriovoracaceae bacterium]
MNDFQNIKNLEFSLIGKECRLKGDFSFNGHTRVAGHIAGEISLENDDILSIEPNGSIVGTIKCKDLEIYGRFEGEITSKGKVTIYPSAEVSGILRSKNLEVYPGALLNLDGFTSNQEVSD